MKNIKSVCVFILLVTVLVMFSSCATILENSNGYSFDLNNDKELKNRPSWWNSTPGNQVIDEKTQSRIGNELKENDGTIKVYFVGYGESVSNKENIANMLSEALNAAQTDVVNQISQYLNLRVTVKTESDISQKVTLEKDTKKNTDNTIVNLDKVIKENSTHYSSAYFNGLIQEGKYWERSRLSWIEGGKKKVQAKLLCWISKDNLEEALNTIKDKESLERKERELFEKKKERAEIIIKYLDTTYQIDESENVYKDYKEKYYELNEIKTQLEGFNLYKDLEEEDPELIEYTKQINIISEALKKYDISDLQKLKYEARIRELINERDQNDAINKEQIKKLEINVSELNITKDDAIKQRDELIQQLNDEILKLETQIETSSNVIEEYTALLRQTIINLLKETSLETIEAYTSKLQKEIADLQKNGIQTVIR